MALSSFRGGGGGEERIDYQIRIEAAQALKNLDGITSRASGLPEVVQAVETEVQKLADKFGVSFGTAQKEIQDTIKKAKELREAMKGLAEQGVNVNYSPAVLATAAAKSPFGAMGDAVGWKAVSDAHRESAAIAKDEAKSEADVAKATNTATEAEAKKALERQKNLDLAQQEQLAVEKEGAVLQNQLATYGQISRTAAETAKYLRSFAGTEQGQSILTKFFGNYQQAQGVAQQINVVKNSIRELSRATGTDFAQSAKVFNDQFSQIPGITQQTSRAVKELNAEFNKTDDVTKRSVRSIDAVRIALGALVAMLIFNVIQAIQNTFREMINNVKEAELAVYNLINAERRLSQEGIDVTPKGLQETIDSIQKLVPVISKIQAEELVSRVSTNVAPALKLTNEQIGQLSESIALLYVRNKALGKSFDEVEAQVTNAFLTGKVSQGINQLGVKISDQIVKDEALRLGLVKTEEEFKNLTGETEAHVKAAAMLSVVYKNAKQDMGSIGDYMNTLDAQSSRAATAWSNFLTAFGEVFGPLLAQGLEVIAHGLEIITVLLEHFKDPLINIVALTVAWVDTMKDIPQYLKLGGGKLFEKNFAQNLANAKKQFKDLADAMDTATASMDGLGESADNLDVSGLKQKLDDIVQDTNNGVIDLRGKLLDKIEDLNVEYQRKAVDAEKDYLRKVEDINIDYQRSLQDIKNKQREQDKKDEEKYQLALWELRMRYLMDLEDALHARDARQVLRLMNQYKLDKEVMEKKHGLDVKQREEDQRAELEDAKRKRDQRLADAKLEYQQKLVDQQKAKEREMEDLQTWYQREIADLQTAQQRKLQTLLKGWIDEQKITQQNAAAVYGILKTYFGPGGMTDQLYQYMMQSLVATTQAAGQAAQAINQYGGVGNSPYGPPKPPSYVAPPPNSTVYAGHFAKGGQFVATRPTSAIFGESGKELVTVTPLSKISGMQGRQSIGADGMNGKDGMTRIYVDLNLSPDLEARVVEKSMNSVAGVLTKINKTKMRG